MKKVLMLATTAAMIEQFNKYNIEVLNELGYVVDVIGNFDIGNPISQERLTAFRDWIHLQGGECYNYPATRKPLDIVNNYKAYRTAVKLVNENKYDFIHCHNPIGAVIGRLTAHTTKTKLIYTAHGFHFFKNAPLKNWLVFYPVEKFLSKWTDILVLINREDYDLARRKFHMKELFLVPGVGIDYDRLSQNTGVSKREELGLTDDDFVITSVGELIPRKNMEAGIHALACIKADDPDSFSRIFYVICGQGPEKNRLEELAAALGVEDHVKLVGFRNDVSDILFSSDMFLFMSHQEGLSVALLEAMAKGKLIVCSRIRGNVDLISDGVNGFLLNNDSSTTKELGELIKRICDDPDAYKKVAEQARQSAKEYDYRLIQQRMKEIYKTI